MIVDFPTQFEPKEHEGKYVVVAADRSILRLTDKRAAACQAALGAWGATLYVIQAGKLRAEAITPAAPQEA